MIVLKSFWVPRDNAVSLNVDIFDDDSVLIWTGTRIVVYPDVKASTTEYLRLACGTSHYKAITIDELDERIRAYIVHFLVTDTGGVECVL